MNANYVARYQLVVCGQVLGQGWIHVTFEVAKLPGRHRMALGRIRPRLRRVQCSMSNSSARVMGPRSAFTGFRGAGQVRRALGGSRRGSLCLLATNLTWWTERGSGSPDLSVVAAMMM
ncbi:hypothetical protein BST30_26115 [Mycobacterium mantenii]|uniref:Uncharacterized protein n=1 Tax=Mycobacterium mantenii TaxID=560555 RepID=A0A1X0F916_MYCNT|nr:hypothetical protein BST30_26115 [Mycobacterium mantenii]